MPDDYESLGRTHRLEVDREVRARLDEIYAEERRDGTMSIICDTCKKPIPNEHADELIMDDGTHKCEACRDKEDTASRLEALKAEAEALGFKLVKPRTRKAKVGEKA